MVIVRSKGIDTPFWCCSLLCRCGKDEPRCIKSSIYTCLEDWAKKQTAQENHLPPSGQQECTCPAHRSTRSSQRFPEPTPNKLGHPANMTEARMESLDYSEEKESHISVAYCQAQPTPKLLGSAAISRWHDYIPPSAELPWASPQGAASHRVEPLSGVTVKTARGQEREERHLPEVTQLVSHRARFCAQLQPAVHLTTLSVCQQRAQNTVWATCAHMVAGMLLRRKKTITDHLRIT